MGYTEYTVRDGYNEVVDARDARSITTERIVHAPALRKKRYNYRGFYNLENKPSGILSTQLRE